VSRFPGKAAARFTLGSSAAPGTRPRAAGAFRFDVAVPVLSDDAPEGWAEYVAKMKDIGSVTFDKEATFDPPPPPIGDDGAALG
jgi:hypothetical protein